MSRMYRMALAAALTALLPAHALAQDAPRALQIRTAPAAWIGLTYDAAEDADGVRVRVVQDESPAARAGIRPDDLILRLNGFRASPHSMRTLTTMLEPGDTVQLTLRRGQRTMDLAVVAETRPDGRSAGDGHVFDLELGRLLEGVMDSMRVRMRNLPNIRILIESDTLPDGQRIDRAPRMMFINPDGDTIRMPQFRWAPGDTSEFWARFRSPDSAWTGFRTWNDSAQAGNARTWVPFFGPEGVVIRPFETGARAIAGAELIAVGPGLARIIRGADRGLFVDRVAPESPAARAGLVAGDVIVTAEGQAVSDITALRRIVAAAEGPVRLTVVRDGQRQELRLPRGR